MELSCYSNKTDYGLACWVDGKLLEVTESVQNTRDTVRITYEITIEGLIRALTTRHGRIKVAAIEADVKRHGVSKIIPQVLRVFTPQTLEITTIPEIVDKAVELLSKLGSKTSAMQLGAVQIGIAAGFGSKMDDKAVTASLNALTSQSFCKDPGVLEEISKVALNFYAKAVNENDPITPEDCVKIRALTLFAEILDLDNETKARLRKFGDGIERLHVRLQGDKRIDISATAQVQEDVKEIYKKLEEYEAKSGKN